MHVLLKSKKTLGSDDIKTGLFVTTNDEGKAEAFIVCDFREKDFTSTKKYNRLDGLYYGVEEEYSYSSHIFTIIEAALEYYNLKE